jgi:hypothetical protein
MEVYRWFGVVEILSGNIWFLLDIFLSSIDRDRKAKKGLLLVWHAMIWVIWRTRNDKFFSNTESVSGEVFNRIKSLLGLVAKKDDSPSMYYEQGWSRDFGGLELKIKMDPNNKNIIFLRKTSYI